LQHSINSNANTIIQHIARLDCNTILENVDVNTTFVEFDLNIASQNPPQPREHYQCVQRDDHEFEPRATGDRLIYVGLTRTDTNPQHLDEFFATPISSPLLYALLSALLATLLTALLAALPGAVGGNETHLSRSTIIHYIVS
jgi:hypothetical protein